MLLASFILIAISSAGACSSDDDCDFSNGWYCHSSAVCVEWTTDYCENNECGDGDGPCVDHEWKNHLVSETFCNGDNMMCVEMGFERYYHPTVVVASNSHGCYLRKPCTSDADCQDGRAFLSYCFSDGMCVPFSSSANLCGGGPNLRDGNRGYMCEAYDGKCDSLTDCAPGFTCAEMGSFDVHHPLSVHNANNDGVCIPYAESSGYTEETSASGLFEYKGNGCVVDGDCISTNGWGVSFYGNAEWCMVTALTKSTLTLDESLFDIEWCGAKSYEGCDELYVAGVHMNWAVKDEADGGYYDADDNIQAIPLMPAEIACGQQINWITDTGGGHEGWKFCFAEVPNRDCTVSNECDWWMSEEVCTTRGTCEHQRCATPVDCVVDDVASAAGCTFECTDAPAVVQSDARFGGADCTASYDCSPGAGACIMTLALATSFKTAHKIVNRPGARHRWNMLWFEKQLGRLAWGGFTGMSNPYQDEFRTWYNSLKTKEYSSDNWSSLQTMINDFKSTNSIRFAEEVTD